MVVFFFFFVFFFITITGCCVQPFFVLVYIVFQSLHIWILTILNADEFLIFFSCLIESIYVIIDYNTLLIVICFIVLWFIFLRFSLVQFKKSPEYFTRRTAQVFIHLNRFLLLSWVLKSFFLLKKKYSFLTFCFIFAWSYPLLIFSGICCCLFLQVLRCFLNMAVFSLSFFIINMTQFPIPNSLQYLSWRFSLFAFVSFFRIFHSLKKSHHPWR